MALAQRVELQDLLETLCDNVYFQPPQNVKLVYPCIIYTRDLAWVKHADNHPQFFMMRYAVTVIDRDPDSPIRDAVAQLQLCTFNRHFAADDLNHDVYNLYWKGT